jgi:hypothetical protein
MSIFHLLKYSIPAEGPTFKYIQSLPIDIQLRFYSETVPNYVGNYNIESMVIRQKNITNILLNWPDPEDMP